MKALILLGDAGGGHMSAAMAVSEGIKLVDPKSKVEIVDFSKLATSFPFAATDSFWQVVSKYPIVEFVSNSLYRFTNTSIGNIVAHRAVSLTGTELVRATIKEYMPDVVVSTHFIVSAILEKLKPEFPGVLTVSIAADLVGFPRMLADRNADLIFCATEKAAARLHKFGIKPDNIRFPRFPVNPNLRKFRDRDVVLQECDLQLSKGTMLITGGGVGTISMLANIDEVVNLKNYQTIIICGKNTNTQKLLQDRYGDVQNVVLLGFVDNIQDYYNAADLIIAKPGPATIIEIEAFQKKAIFTKIIGKQEQGNINFLKQNPNFTYLPEQTTSLGQLVDEGLKNGVVKFSPRFDFESSKTIAEELFLLVKGVC